jgi:type III restriction enzyme
MNLANPSQLPIQSVEQPILFSPYAEPKEHWVYTTSTSEVQHMHGNRPKSYLIKTHHVMTE